MPSPNSRDEKTDTPKKKYNIIGVRIRADSETIRLARIVRLTYALKVIFISYLSRFLSRSLNNGINFAVLSPNRL